MMIQNPFSRTRCIGRMGMGNMIGVEILSTKQIAVISVKEKPN
jgi:hypothetical protein